VYVKRETSLNSKDNFEDFLLFCYFDGWFYEIREANDRK
jgi:hypothetical protein